MAFDPSIISAIPDMAGNPIQAQEKALTLKDMLDRNQLNQLQVGTAKREESERAQVDKILKGSDYTTPQGLADTVSKVNKVSPRAGMDLMKFGQQYQSGQIQQQLDELNFASQRQDAIVGAIDPIVAQARQMKQNGASDLDIKAFITQQMPGAISSLRGMKLPDGKPALSDDALKFVTQIPGGYTLQTLEGWEGVTKRGQAMIKQRLEQFKADTQAKKADVDEQRAMETERHNRASEANQAAKSAGFSDTESDLLAALADNSVSLPAGLRSQAQIKSTIDGLIRNHPDLSATEIAQGIKSGKLKLAAETKGAQTAGTQIGKVALAANELNTFGDQTLQAAQAVPRGNFVPYNTFKNWSEKQLSDKGLLRLKTKLQALENAYNQLAARSGTDVDKRAHIHELFNAANSTEAIGTLVQSLREEAAGAKQAADQTIAETSGTAIPGAGPANSPGAGTGAAPSPPTAATGAAPGGALKKGNVYQHPSGAKVEIIE